jgi:hypothetical protein
MNQINILFTAESLRQGNFVTGHPDSVQYHPMGLLARRKAK